MNEVLELRKIAGRIRKDWHPLRVGRINDYDLKLTTIKGDFVWHKHDDTDEAFLVVSGEMRIDLRNGSVRLREGDLYVVPRGVEHKPYAGDRCAVLIIEPAGTLNTGDQISTRTVYQPDIL